MSYILSSWGAAEQALDTTIQAFMASINYTYTWTLTQKVGPTSDFMDMA